MPTELFERFPEPSREAEERALARALAALAAPSVRRPGLGRPAFAVAAALAALLIAAGALAATGDLHVSVGPARAAKPQLVLPGGARGIAAVVDGRLWLTTRSGLRIEGLPVSAAALSPHALYVAAGLGDSLVAMAPDGRRAWSYSAGGRVAAIAWAPSGLRIAYVVRSGRGFALHALEGNGAGNVLLDASVRPVRPSWRADSLALAYVGAGGEPVVYDLAHRSRRTLAIRGATQLAFAPHGAALAVATARRVRVGDASAPLRGATQLAWSGADLEVALPATILRFRRDGDRLLGAGATPIGALGLPRGSRVTTLDRR